MAKQSPAQTSFAGGELSPLLEGRTDLVKYPIGCRKLRNFLPMIQGPAIKRGGTVFIAEIKDSTAVTWLKDFRFSETDALIIEYGHQYNRFFRNRGSVNVSGAAAYSSAVTYALNAYATDGGIQYRSLQAANLNHTPASSPTYWVAQDAYEIASPYTSANLINNESSFGLSIAQSADVMYIAQADVGPRTLSRTSNTAWAYATYQPEDGPFDPQNIDKTIAVQVSATTGTVTLTNDAADVPVPSGTTSRLIRVEETNKSVVKPWEANKSVAREGENPNGQYRRSDGHLYQCATNEVVPTGGVEFRTGSEKPIHTEGTEGDGDGQPLLSGYTIFAFRVGVDWTYLHSGYGIGRITAVAGGGMTATLVINANTQFPASIVAGASYRWSLGAWYTGHFPSCVAFYRDRLAWAGGQRVQLTVAADYSSMAGDEFGEVLPDSAIDVQISIGSMDQVNWLVPQPGALLIGTGGAALAFEEITRNAVLGPANSKFEPEGAVGSRKIAPLTIAEYTLFVQQGGRKLREAQYSAEIERFVAVDLTAFSEHITTSGLTGFAYCQNPDSLVWCVRADGKLACLTYQRAEDVLAWSLHDVGGVVESVASIPSPDTGIDDLYMIVRRTINGTVKRYLEVLLPYYTPPNDPHTYCYQDCSLSYDGTKAVTLALGTGYGTVGASVTATAGSATFSSGDIGREIRRRYYDADQEKWFTSCGVITAYTSTTVVTVEIVSAFLSNSFAAGAWGLTASVLTGYGHLNGEVVRIVADGATHVNRTVSGGSVTLTRQALHAHVGKAVRGVVQLMDLEAGAADGTAQGKIKKIATVGFRLFETMGGQFGPNLVDLDPVDYRVPADPMNQGVPLFTGIISVPWNNGFEIEGRITFVHNEGLPCCLCAVYPQVRTEDDRVGSKY